jgi:hypothetical protein
MRDRRLAGCLLYPVLLLAGVAGCQGFYQYRPLVVLARDAETKEPIPDARVEVAYPLAAEGDAPDGISRITGKDGIARLRAAPWGDGARVTATADGYLGADKPLPVADVNGLQPAYPFEPIDQRPATVVLELFARPRPMVELIVPAGYRGLVQVEVQARAGALCPPGQRWFPAVVSAAGVAVVTGPPVLGHQTDFCARYADGPALAVQPRDGSVGLWWLSGDGPRQTFLVGTQRDYGDRHPSVPPVSDQQSGVKGQR